jgi:Flp pilus assembly protein TadD
MRRCEIRFLCRSRILLCILLAPLLWPVSACDMTKQEHFKFYNDDGIFLFSRGDYKSALEDFQAALELKPDDPNLLYNVGQAYDRLGDPVRAEKYYLQCLDVVSGHEEARHALAELWYRTGRKDQAARMIQDWLVAEPQKAAPYAEDGWLLRMQKNYPNAHGRLQQALAIDPHNLRALTELGILFEEENMPDRALVLYERALEFHPRQTELIRRIQMLRTKQIQPPMPPS